MTVVDPEQFTNKSKSIIYIGIFVGLYNLKNHGQVYEIHKMVEFEKIYISTAKYPRNLVVHCIIAISSILCNTHIVFGHQKKILFYVNNSIN